jgi:HD-GYP domain-containing protein (c-di-GMP phosphodiesterase class II)
MTETRALLGKIAALRHRLDHAQKAASDATLASVTLQDGGAPDSFVVLQRKVDAGDEHDIALDGVVRAVSPPEPLALPNRLTMRARRVLERGRTLLTRLRDMADAFASPLADAGATPLFGRADPLTVLYRETAAMTDTSLRLIPMFPQIPSAQMNLCEGLEAILAVIAERLKLLTAGVEIRRAEEDRIDRLVTLLTDLEAGRPADVQPFLALAEEIVTDARDGGPLLFREGDLARPAHFAACQGLTTARVAVRVALGCPEWRNRLVDVALAALIHDVGMLRVPSDIIAQTGPLTLDQRRAVEAHCRVGAEMAARVQPQAAWLAQAVAEHHERMDGTGYPAGLRGAQLSSLSRLLTVCDVYAAACTARSYRKAKETRTALTDVLLMAGNGMLDRDDAERLLEVSFYPVGTAVALADGSSGLVTAVPAGRRDGNGPARPVVAILTDERGENLPAPRHIDLARRDGPAIVRSLSAPERRALLGARFPEWA